MGNRETAFDDAVCKYTKLTDDIDPNKLNLSLNGCGYLGIYHVGVCACFRKYYPQVLTHKISGGSVGALVAATFMCEVPLSIAVRYVFDVSMKVRSGVLGPMSPSLNIMNLLYDRMDKMLPPDAHIRCNGRLNASVTRFDNNRNVLLTEFKSREDLLQVLMCSCFIPIYCGYELPKFEGTAYVDAALSNNSPRVDDHTVTVAPFSGRSDICPENEGWFFKSLTLNNTNIQLNRQNLCMMFRVLFPGTPDMQKEYCQQGYNDALRFLRDKGLLPCPTCGSQDKTSDHSQCGPIQEMLPKEITDEFELSIQCCRRDFRYRLMQYKSMKILYYLNIPSIVTAKVAYTAASMVVQAVQRKAGPCVDDARKYILQLVKERLDRLEAQLRIIEDPDSDDGKRESESVPELEEGSPSNTSTRSEANNLIGSCPDVEIQVPDRSQTPDQTGSVLSSDEIWAELLKEMNEFNKNIPGGDVSFPPKSSLSNQGDDSSGLINDGSFALDLNVFDTDTEVSVAV